MATTAHLAPDASPVLAHLGAARMMDRGMFSHGHSWRSPTGWTVEYWRGMERNGACVRAHDHLGRNLWVKHFPMPGDALLWLVRSGYEVPGVVASA